MILDTNALSAFLDGDADLVELLRQASALHLPVIVLGEYQFGLKASKLKKLREPQLRAFVKTCTVLSVMESTIPFYATIRDGLRRAGTPIPENDIWICSLALEYKLPVVSRDAHFRIVKQVDSVGW